MEQGNIYAPKYIDPLNGQSAVAIDLRVGERVQIGHFSVIRDGCYIDDRSRIGFFTVIDEKCRFGTNVFVGNQTMIRSNVTVGNDSTIGHSVVIESDTTIGDRVTIQSQTHITGHALIENDVFIGPNATTSNTRHISHGRAFRPVIMGPIIRRAARIGAGATLLPGITIGENSVVGAGATVTKDVPDYEIWIGNPAKPLIELKYNDRTGKKEPVFDNHGNMKTVKVPNHERL
jgi:acetyltransferase-like isoleucine patch superfamily enzyme